VQGILENNGKSFKEGQFYSSGSIILQINSDEFMASLLAQRSAFYNTLMSTLPDLQLDYPTVYVKWKQYINDFDINQRTNPLPAFDTEQEKYFINSRNIVNTYFTIKNLEERLNKYRIQAPYDGIVTEALVNQGALIRAGQKIGEFINPSNYELRISLSERYIDMVNVGNVVDLYNLNRTESYVGKVSRINRVIDPSTQSIEVFIQVSAPGLNDGMYLEAHLEGKEVEEVFEISRSLLVDNEEVFTVQDGKLKKVAVHLVHFTEETALVKGLVNGTVLLNNNIPGAYDGMLVEIATQ
jgi:RND family efflux transporter MFP subunit